MAVTILNSGGPINEPDAFLSLTLDKDTISTGISLNLNKGESATELIQFFLTGDYPFYELKLLASASGPVIASFVFPNPNAAITPEPTETETPDPTAEETTTS